MRSNCMYNKYYYYGKGTHRENTSTYLPESRNLYVNAIISQFCGYLHACIHMVSCNASVIHFLYSMQKKSTIIIIIIINK